MTSFGRAPRRTRLRLDHLETRVCPASTATLLNGVLTVLGDSSANTLSVTLSGGYRHTQGLSGPDIGAPAFTSWPIAREISQLAEFSLSYTDKGGRTYAVFGGVSLDGRNTGDKTLFGATISIPIQLR